MYNTSTYNDELIEKQYTIIRNYGYGRELNVYKAHEVNKPRVYYVIKYYSTNDAFERESRMLEMLRDTKNIIQMIECYPQKAIVCECALYDLETFLGHQDYSQRHKEEGDIIRDVVAGLCELKKHNIVHTELAPKNIMYFQEKDGYTENWKLIDFDSACIADQDFVEIVTNYSAPEVLRADEDGKEIIANFEMDMFSFGLVLYYLETGHHYWDGEDEREKNEMISARYLSLRDVHNPSACCIIRQLIVKSISSRMTLEKFMQTSYYTDKLGRQKKRSRSMHIFGDEILEEPKSINGPEYNADHLFGMSEIGFQLYQAKLTQGAYQAFLDKYHNEMKEYLKIMSNKIDDCTKAVGDLTKKIPQWLVKVKNEKVPGVFVMIPDKKDWKKPSSWLLKPFRLFFICEHKGQWHIPKQAGYKIRLVPQFIKKYGPWINLCLKALSSIVSIMASQAIAELLSEIFSLVDNVDITQHFQEIIDTVDIGVKTIPDDDPKFVPLNNENNYQTINATGLRELKRFLDTQESPNHYGGLIQCVEEETQDIFWLCEEHRDGYRVKQPDPEEHKDGYDVKHSKDEYHTHTKQRGLSSLSNISETSSCKDEYYAKQRSLSIMSKASSLKDIKDENSKRPPKSPIWTPPLSPVSVETIFVLPEQGDKFYEKELVEPLHPFYALDYVYKILCEVIENAVISGRKHFRSDDIREISEKMRGHLSRFKDVCPNWNDESQRYEFIKILENQVHLYIHFLRSIIRYCSTIKDDNRPIAAFAKQLSFLYNDTFEINDIIRSGKSFNKHLHRLIINLSKPQFDAKKIRTELDSFANDSNLNVNVDDSNIISNKALSGWYHIANNIIDDIIDDETDKVVPTEIEIKEGFFNTIKRSLNNTILAEKSLRYLNVNNLSCVEKEIYLYDEHHLNNNDYIINFRGFSVYSCKLVLFYDYAEYDLFTYFQLNHNSSENLLKDWKEKVKLAWDISQGVKYLHKNNIVHLDLRSENILLKYDEEEKVLKPKISNFLWSRSLNKKTFVNPTITTEKIWKRWYDPDRLMDKESFVPSSDIYSLGLLFWEIAWCKADNFPFKGVSIKNLYNHLQKSNQEKLPEIPTEYQNWELLISKMWRLERGKRSNIETVESKMGLLYSDISK